MVAEHQLNRESSRSHTIFSIMLERSTGAEGDEVIVSKLNLVDLAGSERISKTKSEGTVLKEAQQINKSLSFLEQVSYISSGQTLSCSTHFTQLDKRIVCRAASHNTLVSPVRLCVIWYLRQILS